MVLGANLNCSESGVETRCGRRPPMMDRMKFSCVFNQAVGFQCRSPGQVGGLQIQRTLDPSSSPSTTHSREPGDFLKVYERPRIGGDLCDGSFSETASLQSAGRFCAFFSGPEIPFPGNGDRERQRLGSNAGYAEGSPSIWCCRDHSAGMSARRATPMP